MSGSTVSGVWLPSATTITRSALSTARRERSTPSRLHGVVCLADAAVSMSRSSTPPTTAFSSTVSRVVPGKVGDDGAVVAHERVEQRAFARVRRADDGGRRAAFEHASARKGAEQSRERLFALRERPLRLGKREVLDVLVGIVHHGVEAAW